MWLLGWSIRIRDADVLLGILGSPGDCAPKRKGMPHRTPFPIATHLRSVHSDLRLLSALGHEVVRFPWCRRFDCGVGERVALGVGECDCEPVGRSLFYSEEGMTNGLSGPHGRCRGSVKGYLDDDDHAAFAPENPGSGISHSIPCGLCDTNGPSPDDELGSTAFRVLWRRPQSLSTLLPPKELRDPPFIHHERATQPALTTLHRRRAMSELISQSGVFIRSHGGLSCDGGHEKGA